MRILKAGLMAFAVSVTAASAQDADLGRALYQAHCANCHGAEADGQGPLTGALILKPTDLTALSVRNEGVFPLEQVVRRIDGRDPLVSHGSPMPVFGDFSEGVANVGMKLPSGQPIMVSQPVADLVGYLLSVQDGE